MRTTLSFLTLLSLLIAAPVVAADGPDTPATSEVSSGKSIKVGKIRIPPHEQSERAAAFIKTLSREDRALFPKEITWKSHPDAVVLGDGEITGNEKALEELRKRGEGPVVKQNRRTIIESNGMIFSGLIWEECTSRAPTAPCKTYRKVELALLRAEPLQDSPRPWPGSWGGGTADGVYGMLDVTFVRASMLAQKARVILRDASGPTGQCEPMGWPDRPSLTRDAAKWRIIETLADESRYVTYHRLERWWEDLQKYELALNGCEIRDHWVVMVRGRHIMKLIFGAAVVEGHTFL